MKTDPERGRFFCLSYKKPAIVHFITVLLRAAEGVLLILPQKFFEVIFLVHECYASLEESFLYQEVA